MTEDSSQNRLVLILSANPLFREGLRKLYAERWGEKSAAIVMLTGMAEALHALETQHPDLVIVDYDDRGINRDEFLNNFVTGHSPMQVMLVSLQESGNVVVYDRRTLTFAQAEDWLNNPWNEKSYRQSARK